MAELLALDDVTAGYGESVVLDGVSLAIDDGDSLALLGRNGVGKSTTLVTMMGLTKVHKGRLRWKGSDLAAVPTHERAHAGIGWVPQERFMWPSLTIEEHLTAVARPGPWNVERVNTAIRAIVADAEEAFDDGWPTHPADQDDDLPPGTRLRTVYLGGAGVVARLGAPTR